MDEREINDLGEDLNIKKVRSPGSAAVAGIVFSLLITTSMLLLTSVTAINPDDINEAWLNETEQSVRLAIGLVPFAGISFLWFTGVIRDLLGHREDQFFATVFLGSGLIFVATLFIWAATVGAIYGTFATVANQLVDSVIYVFGFKLMNEIMGNFTLRMAGVYVLSIGTLWLRTKVLPRWLIVITYVVALSFLIFAGVFRHIRFIFPAWVLVVSVYVLIANRRRNKETD